MKASVLRLAMNLWPPFRGAGIRVRSISTDYAEVHVEMSLGVLNRNYVGTHFGGSLYAMTDPFFMLMVLHRLGRGYTVAHKAGAIEYLRPARGRVRATFAVSDSAIERIRRRTAGGEKYLPVFRAEVVDDAGHVVARVRHTLYVRKRVAGARAARPAGVRKAARRPASRRAGPS
jgi:acyl-coenzyme A thioesterase PaaI-like protein